MEDGAGCMKYEDNLCLGMTAGICAETSEEDIRICCCWAE